MAYPSTFNLPISLYVKWVSHGKHVVKAWLFKIHFHNVSFLIDVYRPFTFNVIVDMFRFRSIVLFFIFCSSFICFSFPAFFWTIWTIFLVFDLYCVFDYISLCRFLVVALRIAVYTLNFIIYSDSVLYYFKWNVKTLPSYLSFYMSLPRCHNCHILYLNTLITLSYI